MGSQRAAATRGRPRKNWSAPPLWPPPAAASSPLPPSPSFHRPHKNRPHITTPEGNNVCNYDMSLEMFHKTCPNQKASVISCATALLLYLRGKRTTNSEWGTFIPDVLSELCLRGESKFLFSAPLEQLK